MQQKSIIAIIIALIIAVVVIKGCYRTKRIEVKQTSDDQKSRLSVEIKKEKPEEVNV